MQLRDDDALGPLMMRYQLSVMSRQFPRYTSCSRSPWTGFFVGLASLSSTTRRTFDAQRGRRKSIRETGILTGRSTPRQAIAHILERRCAGIAWNMGNTLSNAGVQGRDFVALGTPTIRLCRKSPVGIQLDREYGVRECRTLAEVLRMLLFGEHEYAIKAFPRRLRRISMALTRRIKRVEATPA